MKLNSRHTGPTVAWRDLTLHLVEEEKPRKITYGDVKIKSNVTKKHRVHPTTHFRRGCKSLSWKHHNPDPGDETPNKNSVFSDRRAWKKYRSRMCVSSITERTVNVVISCYRVGTEHIISRNNVTVNCQ